MDSNADVTVEGHNISTGTSTATSVEALSIFEDAWSSLETQNGREGMALPKEIMWLGGAPGSGKGTNTNFIMRERGLTAPPIVISDLLKTPEMEKIKAKGGMVGDAEVTSLLLKELLDKKYTTGVVVDGFPRTAVQADITRQLYDKMMKNYNTFKNTRDDFLRPIFRICVLYVDRTESVNRQLARGKNAVAHNARVRESGEGTLKPERATDFDSSLASKRYETFKESTFSALEELGDHFIYNMVQAMGTFDQVENNIKREMDYQSGLELNPDTHGQIHHLPRASEVIRHARQTLVSRLDEFSQRHPSEFNQAIQLLERIVYPTIHRHALSGKCEVCLADTPFESSEILSDIAMSVLTDRGFRVVEVKRGEEGTLGRYLVEWEAPQLRSQ